MSFIQSTLGGQRREFWRARDKSGWSRRNRSLFQRLVSGVRKARVVKKQVWFITLTTSDEYLELFRLGCGLSYARDFNAFVKRARGS